DPVGGQCRLSDRSRHGSINKKSIGAEKVCRLDSGESVARVGRAPARTALRRRVGSRSGEDSRCRAPRAFSTPGRQRFFERCAAAAGKPLGGIFSAPDCHRTKIRRRARPRYRRTRRSRGELRRILRPPAPLQARRVPAHRRARPDALGERGRNRARAERPRRCRARCGLPFRPRGSRARLRRLASARVRAGQPLRDPRHGKLGGGELNFSSDIDVIFLYESDEGESAGGARGKSTPREFFSAVARKIIHAMGQVSEEGFVFRIDLRLRPMGNSGPLVQSVGSSMLYYESWGQCWERAALIKARPAAGDLDLGKEFLREVEPFIYRRYLDYTTVEELRHLKLRIENELLSPAEKE